MNGQDSRRTECAEWPLRELGLEIELLRPIEDLANWMPWIYQVTSPMGIRSRNIYGWSCISSVTYFSRCEGMSVEVGIKGAGKM